MFWQTWHVLIFFDMRAKYFAEPWLWDWPWTAINKSFNRHVTGRELIRSGGKPSFLCLCGCHQKSFLPGIWVFETGAQNAHMCSRPEPSQEGRGWPSWPHIETETLEQPHRMRINVAGQNHSVQVAYLTAIAFAATTRGNWHIMGNRVVLCSNYKSIPFELEQKYSKSP